ncbi:MAG: polysaccharide deacetylase family protein [Novosphingobium sp.]
MDITELPNTPDLAKFRDSFGQKFLVTVDTEEEFDWNAPLDRERHSLVAVSALRDFQEFCEGFGVVPVYLMNYPVVNSPIAIKVLGDAVREGRAEAGIHLHPWVNPPYTEEVNQRNSYPGNLPADLEREKLLNLCQAIEMNLGAAPLIYRAGRYGAGPNSAAILREARVVIDTSVRANFDYSYNGGPDYRDHPLRPYWLDREGGLLELPVTTVYWGMLRQIGGAIYPRLWRTPRLRGALARTGMLERIPLTPEGITPQEAIRGIDIALDDGLPLLVFSFHSPSLAPGYTPYVRSADDLAAFYDWWREIFAYLEKRNVAPSSVKDIMASVTLA